ncbi:MAG: alpha/beta fold hydrolase [Burkholderiales bacterium]|nr:alpha/beta fold hydrolase [Betaproteobacteria bacterium]
MKAPHWLTHLEHEWHSPIWRPWIEGLSRSHQLIRMDQRCCGLSDWGVDEVLFEALIHDLEAVVDAAGLDCFALVGHSQGGTIAMEYAVRHPERVSHLVLLGAFARGALRRNTSARAVEEQEALLKLVEVGWGRNDDSYRQLFSGQFLPGGSIEQIQSFSELQRLSASAENAVRIMRAWQSIDISDSAQRVQCPTLIMHARNDRRIPFEEARRLAASIPGARLVPLESENHILLEREPAFAQFFEEMRAFVGAGERATIRTALPSLTARETAVLDRIAEGLDNAQIAAHLTLSEKTVRNYVTQIFDKLGVENRSQTIVLARKNGYGSR